MQDIENANPSDTVYLPNELIMIHDLLIKKPIKLKGNEDTILYIKNGSIRVSFDQR